MQPRKNEIMLKLTGKMTGKEIIDAIASFFQVIFFFLALAKIFESKEIEREFKELIYELIPALNECERCEILKYKYCYKFSSRCSLCRKARCTNCY